MGIRLWKKQQLMVLSPAVHFFSHVGQTSVAASRRVLLALSHFGSSCPIPFLQRHIMSLYLASNCQDNLIVF